MLEKFDKAYVYFYWRLSLWLRSSFDVFENLYKWKGSVAVGALEIFVIAVFVNIFFTIFDGLKLPNNLMPILISLALILAFGNQFIFGRRQAKAYITEFQQHTRQQRTRGGLAVAACVFIILAMLIFSFWLLSESKEPMGVRLDG